MDLVKSAFFMNALFSRLENNAEFCNKIEKNSILTTSFAKALL